MPRPPKGPPKTRAVLPTPPTASVSLYQRLLELMLFMHDCDGFWPGTKQDCAERLANQYGQPWCRVNGHPDREIVDRCCALSRRQGEDPIAGDICAGMLVVYSPTRGGLSLVDSSGEIPVKNLAHMLQGDLEAQRRQKTVHKSRIADWTAMVKAAFAAGDQVLATVSAKILNEIETNGFVSDGLIVEFIRATAEY